MNKTFYITTTLPYVNADPHIGFALEIVQADVIARFKRAQGHDVFFNTGTDEHGLKIYRKAQEEGKDTKSYVDEYAAKFDKLKTALNLSYDNFIRTTDEHHVKAAQEFWKRCDKNGDIEKRTYSVKYCVGCELEKTDSELNDEGKCSLHPQQDIELIEEENYFFKFSKYQDKLLQLYTEQPDFVVPKSRLKEIKSFTEHGLKDFSISRLKEKLPWGVPVPGDDTQVMYVWFDALVNYISAIGWPDDEEKFKKYWPVVQVAGKDNLRQQSAMWQAMLASAGLPFSKQIFIHGFITHDGQKMSKSVGNVVDPYELVEKYGTDAVRYFLLRGINPYEDSDFSIKRFEEIYNADLANGLGNLVARILKLAEDNLKTSNDWDTQGYKFLGYLPEKLGEYRFDLAIDYIWDKIAELDREIQEKKPWESRDKELIKNLLLKLYRIGKMLEPFLPETAKVIINASKTNKKPENLFPRFN